MVTTFDDLQKITFGSDEFYATASWSLAGKHMFAKHQIIGQDAADIEPTGKDSDDITVEVVLNNVLQPDAFPKRWLALWRFFQFKSSNLLTLPGGDTHYCFFNTFSAQATPNNRAGVIVRCGFIETLDPANFVRPDLSLLPTTIPTVNVAALASLTPVSPGDLSIIQQVNDGIQQVKSALSKAYFVGATAINQLTEIVAQAYHVFDLFDALAHLGIAEMNEIIESLSMICVTAQQRQLQAQRVKTIGSTTLATDTPMASFCSRYKQSIDDFNSLNPLSVGAVILYQGTELLYYTGASFSL